MTNASRTQYAPANPESYSKRVGTVAQALDALVQIDSSEITASEVTLEARSQLVLSNGVTTITLPSAASMTGNFIVVKNIGTAEVSVASTDLVEGETSLAVDPTESYSLFSDGTTWRVV